jgi:hypothetical protein
VIRFFYAASPHLIPSTGVRRGAFAFALGILALALHTSAQDVPIFKAEATSAFVWGEDNLTGAVSGSLQDPLTGNEIRTISHGGIDVSSQARFELASLGQSGELVSFTTIIINRTDSELSATQAGASVDGYIALPFPVDAAKGLSKKSRNRDREVASLNCLTGSFSSSQLLSYPKAASEAVVVDPGKSVAISFVTRDPRHYSILCSIDGCYPKGAIRFFVTVNSTDFVFVWVGRDIGYCGK